MQIEYYFAYGSNMNPARVEQRGLLVGTPQPARLDGFELAFNKADLRHAGEGHANVMACRGSVVEGVLYKLQHPTEILKMDPFERAPWNYSRDCICVNAPLDGANWTVVWTWTYFANSAVLEDGLAPSKQYLDHLLAGKPWLSPSYYERLVNWPVATPEGAPM